MDLTNVKIEILKSKQKNLNFENKDRFVKVTHIPSGISVTKYNKQQYKAKEEALLEMEYLLELWND